MALTLGRGARPGDRSQAEWTRNWWTWFYSIDENEHPSYGFSTYRMRSNDVNQGRIPPAWSGNEQGENPAADKVWFLAGVQGNGPTSVRSIIPVGQWQAVFVPVYVMSGSQNEFPSKSQKEIEKLVTDDVDAAKNAKGVLFAEFDGEDVSNQIVRIDSKVNDDGWFTVQNIAAENVAGLEVDSLRIISDGYWFCLNLENIIGDHILHIIGKAPNYGTDTIFNLTVRGPPPAP